jgi:hypothetical protein
VHIMLWMRNINFVFLLMIRFQAETSFQIPGLGLKKMHCTE